MIVLDTHTLIWWLTGGASLSRAAKLSIAKAAKENQVVASAISVQNSLTERMASSLPGIG